MPRPRSRRVRMDRLAGQPGNTPRRSANLSERPPSHAPASHSVRQAVTSPRNRGRSIPLLHRLDGLLIGGGEHVVASLTVARLAQVEPGHSAPILGPVSPHPRLLLPGHPLDPCRAFRGAAPVGSATHSPDGCGPSDRLSACHGAVASPSQSRTCVGHGAPLGFGEPPLAIYPGVKSTDRRAARRHAELHLRRPAEEPAQALRRAVHFPQRALRPRSALGPPAGSAGLSAKTDAWT